VFYPMLALGFLFYAPHLGFFWTIFGAAAIALWLVLAFWLALFVLTLRLVRVRFGNGWMLALAPFIWTGLEYFRCELYYLRFGWLTFGMANFKSSVTLVGLGVFGTAFILLTIGVGFQLFRHRRRTIDVMIILMLFLMFREALLLANGHPRIRSGISVAGIQLEGPREPRVLSHLDQARARFPRTELFMLSEYTFDDAPPQSVRDWCASNQVYLVVGGRSAVEPVASAILADVEPGILPGGTAPAPRTTSNKSNPPPTSTTAPGGKMPPSTSGSDA
jgi:hypothetical protein